MIKDRCDILSNVMDIKINDKTLEEALLVSSILSPQEYIYHIKENMYDAEFSFMNGDCGALAISLDLLYGDEDSSFAVIHTSRGMKMMTSQQMNKIVIKIIYGDFLSSER